MHIGGWLHVIGIAVVVVSTALELITIISLALGNTADEERHDEYEHKLEAQYDRVWYDDDIDAVGLQSVNDLIRASMLRVLREAANTAQIRIEIVQRLRPAAFEHLRDQLHRLALFDHNLVLVVNYMRRDARSLGLFHGNRQRAMIRCLNRSHCVLESITQTLLNFC